MDAPDIVKLMAELDDEPDDEPAIGATVKAIVVRFGLGEWVMRYGGVTADKGDAAIEVHMGKVIAVRVNRRGVAYRVAWGGGEPPTWSDGSDLEGLGDEDD